MTRGKRLPRKSHGTGSPIWWTDHTILTVSSLARLRLKRKRAPLRRYEQSCKDLHVAERELWWLPLLMWSRKALHALRRAGAAGHSVPGHGL